MPISKKNLLIILVIYMITSFSFVSTKLVLAEQVAQTNLPHEPLSQLTGENALNDTTVVDVRGTDLGLILKHQEQYYYIFGDTFGCGEGLALNWRSNTMAYSNDTDPSDGIMLNGWIVDSRSGNASELISSKKVDYVEMTCIPTAALSYNGKIFIYYMSVNHWYDIGGMWDCNNASIAVSLDNGQTFTKMNNISWPGGGNFVQFGFVQDQSILSPNSYIYLLATPSGRYKACYLCRVLLNDILNQISYEYYIGNDLMGSPLWDIDQTLAVSIFPLPVGELSVMWNIYLQKWTVFYTDNVHLSIVVRTADNLWGPWSEPYTITDALEYPSLYGSYVHPDFVKNNGEIVYFIMSIFSVYNTFVMSVNLSSLYTISTSGFINIAPFSLQIIFGICSLGIFSFIYRFSRKRDE